jgi:virginiamycin B lyase
LSQIDYRRLTVARDSRDHRQGREGIVRMTGRIWVATWLFLANLFFASWAPLALAQAPTPQQQLPDGPGKDIVQQSCSGCHSLGRFTNSGYSPEEWKTVIAMMRNVGAPLSPDQVPVVTAYLAKNFPAKPAPQPDVIAGPVKVSFKEWTVPTPGSRPHDPLAMPDGTMWYTGQMANVLGRLDPTTGKIKEYQLPPQSGPHGLTNDAAGNIWFTANFDGYIGKLDPKTGLVTQYKMPDPAARDPHTLLFDQNGILWFTVQSGNLVGRLDPKTGEIKLAQPVTPKAQPYGMVINSKGVPFFDEFGANKIGSIDPTTMKITEYVLPHEDARPRRIAITADDIIWYGDYRRGYLGRLDPKTGEVQEWASPGGPKSQPYGIAALHDVIWYSESGVKPNTLVRFDPKTQKFETWIIPSGGGVVRNMMPTKDGHGLALAESGVNGLALVSIH